VLGPDDLFLLLASDGLFDVYTNDEAVDYILSCPNRWCAAEELLREASKASVDNLTCLVVWLNWGYDHTLSTSALDTFAEGKDKSHAKERVGTLHPTKSKDREKKDKDSGKKDKERKKVRKDDPLR